MIIALPVACGANGLALLRISLPRPLQQRGSKLSAPILVPGGQYGIRHVQWLKHARVDQITDRRLEAAFEGEVQQYEPSVRVDVLLARLVALVRFPGGEDPDEIRQCVALSGPGRMILQQQPGCVSC